MLSSMLIYAGLVPLMVAAVAAFSARGLRATPPVAWASGIASGYIVAQIGVQDGAIQSILQPREAADWLPLIALLAWAITLLLASGWRPARFVAAAFAVTVPLRLLAGHARITREWSLVEKLGYLSLLASLIGVIWFLLLASDGDEERPPSGRLACLITVAVGAAAALTLSGSFVYGQLAGALAASLVGAAFSCVPDGISGTYSSATHRCFITGFRGAAGLVACLLVGLLLLGHFYAELPLASFLLLVTGLAIAAAPLPTRLAGHPAWLNFAARALLCLTPLAIALAGLIQESSQSYPY